MGAVGEASEEKAFFGWLALSTVGVWGLVQIEVTWMSWVADLAGTQVVEVRMVGCWTCCWSFPCKGQWMMHEVLTRAVVVGSLKYAGLAADIEYDVMDLLGQEARWSI